MATKESPYEILVYDKSYGFRGWVGGPDSLLVTPRHWLEGTASFGINPNHARANDLLTNGARVEILHHGEKRLTGVINNWQIPNIITGTLTFSVLDDFRIAKNTLAFPVPSHTMTGDQINGQNVEYRTITGTAEYVVKTVMAENLARVGRTDVTIAPNQGRGDTITCTFRMHPPFDRMATAVEQAGLGLSVLQDGANGLVLDVYETTTYAHELSVAAGTIVGGSASYSRPTATRVVVGGQGEGVARTFKQYIDTALEAEWGDVVEVFQDARDSESGDVYATRAAETLAENAPKAGFSLQLSETKHFRYGGENGVHVGDRIPVKVGPLQVTDVLREATLSWTADGGDAATPIVGERTDDADKLLANQLRRLAAGERDRKAR